MLKMLLDEPVRAVKSNGGCVGLEMVIKTRKMGTFKVTHKLKLSKPKKDP